MNFGCQAKVINYPTIGNTCSLAVIVTCHSDLKNHIMQLVNRTIIILKLTLVFTSVSAQQLDTFPPESIPNTEVRYLHSSIVGDDYKISIALPARYRSSCPWLVFHQPAKI